GQHRTAGAPALRCVIDGGSKGARSRGRQSPDIAGPRDIVESTGGSLHAHDLEAAAEARERPIERAREPRRTVLVAGERRAAPLVASVEEPDARMIERRCDRFNFA